MENSSLEIAAWLFISATVEIRKIIQTTVNGNDLLQIRPNVAVALANIQEAENKHEVINKSMRKYFYV